MATGRKKAAAAQASGGDSAILAATLALAACAVLLASASGSDGASSFASALWIAAASGPLFYVAVRLTGFRGDRPLLAALAFLAGFGALLRTRFGVDPVETADGPAGWIYPASLLACTAAVALMRSGRYQALRPLGVPALLAACALIAAIVAFGRRYRGMVFLPGNINPSEIVKPLLVLFLAAGFSSLSGKNSTLPIRTLVLWLIPNALLVLQHDLGLILMLNTVMLCMLFVATGRWSIPVLAAGAAAAGGILLSRMDFHGSVRLAVWRDPFADPTGSGWQVLQSLSSMYVGGLTGVGLGRGSPQEIPIAATDFAYAAIGEELGYFGCVVILAAIASMCIRSFRIAANCGDPLGRFLGIGSALVIVIQTLLNVGGVTKSIPLTGVTLPFISVGGSSLLAVFLLSAIILAISEGGGSGGGRKKMRSILEPSRKKLFRRSKNY